MKTVNRKFKFGEFALISCGGTISRTREEYRLVELFAPTRPGESWCVIWGDLKEFNWQHVIKGPEKDIKALFEWLSNTWLVETSL